MSPPPRIAAVVLTYHPDPAILGRAMASLWRQVDAVLIVDNGSGWNPDALLSALPADAKARIEFMWLGANVGVGAGHNRGIRWAKARGFSHVLLLDHDSIPAPDMVAQLVAGGARLVEEGVRWAAVGPRYVDRHRGDTSGFVRLGLLKPIRLLCDPARTGQLIETDLLISSGAMIPMSVLDTVGEMSEEFFIDQVDDEWIFRARARGFRAFGVCDAVMEHSLGLATFRVWLGRWRNVPLHSPERHYYLFRNIILLMKLAHAPRRHTVNGIVRLLWMGLLFPIFAPRRGRRLYFMGLGIWHGLRGVTGALR
jgi:rhamnosyltransferase